jgi:hypothetical protein
LEIEGPEVGEAIILPSRNKHSPGGRETFAGLLPPLGIFTEWFASHTCDRRNNRQTLPSTLANFAEYEKSSEAINKGGGWIENDEARMTNAERSQKLKALRIFRHLAFELLSSFETVIHC